MPLSSKTILIIVPLLLIWVAWEIARAKKSGTVTILFERLGVERQREPVVYTWLLGCYYLAAVTAVAVWFTALLQPGLFAR